MPEYISYFVMKEPISYFIYLKTFDYLKCVTEINLELGASSKKVLNMYLSG